MGWQSDRPCTPHDDTVSTEQPSHTQHTPAKAKRQLNSNKCVDHAWTHTQKSGAVTSLIAMNCYLTVSLTLVSLSLPGNTAIAHGICRKHFRCRWKDRMVNYQSMIFPKVLATANLWGILKDWHINENVSEVLKYLIWKKQNHEVITDI